MWVRSARRSLRARTPVAGRGAQARVASASDLPPMSARLVQEILGDLRLMLGQDDDARRRWPTLLWIERVLVTDGDIGHVPPWTLRHAALALDRFDARTLGPGAVELRRRIEIVLRRRFRHLPSLARPVGQVAGSERGDFGPLPAQEEFTAFAEL